jgi:ACS family glucarate transporter-like MFS transporter
MKPRQVVLAFLIVLGAIAMVDRVNISVGATSIQRDLAISAAQWGWILGAFSLAYGLFEIPGGVAEDRSVLTNQSRTSSRMSARAANA